MLSQIRPALQFVRSNSWRTVWTEFMRRDAHPFLQFVKYGFCGVAATIVHQGVVLLLSLTLFPARQGMLVDGAVLSEAVRTQHLLISNCIAFPFGVITAYVSNRLWVFTPGRHSTWMEILLFTGVSIIAFFPGLLMVNWLAGHLHLPGWFAQLGFTFTSFLVNFICRKLVIFKS